MTEFILVSRANLITKLRFGIVVWWVSWLLVATGLYGGLSNKVIALVLLSMLGFYLGSSKLFLLENKLQESYHCQNIRSFKFLIYVLFIIICFQLYILSKSANLINELGADFRKAYYDSEIHGSTITFVLYEQFAIPIGLYIISYWVCKRYRGELWFICTTAFFLLDAIIKTGRFPLYYYVFFLIIGHLLGTCRLKFYRIIPIVLALIAFSTYLVIIRKSFIGIFDMNMLVKIFDQAVLKYHVAGFYILDRLMDQSTLHTYSIVPYNTFGYFQYILSLVLRRINIDMSYPQQNLNIALTEGIDIDHIGVYNAFSTNILPFYLDGGFAYSFLMFFILGFLLRARSNLNFQYLSPIDVIVSFVMVFGLFQPIAITGYFFIPMILSLARIEERT